MRILFVFLLAVLATCLPAQLSVGKEAGAGMLPERTITSTLALPETEPAFLTPLLRQEPSTRRPALFGHTPTQVVPQPFDFAAAKPYLAFFCRLELNIEEATRFPVRFRLGEVRGWQQELSKRD